MSTELKIDRILTLLSRQEKEKKKKDLWVSATWIQELTGWDGGRLRQAREDGIIKYEKLRPKVYKYLLSSLPEQFIIKKRVEEVTGNVELPAINLQTA